MQDNQSNRRFPLGVVAGFSALIVATGSAAALWSWNQMSRQNADPTPVELSQDGKRQPSPAAQPSPLNAAGETKAPKQSQLPVTAEKTLQVYWLKDSGNKIALAAAPVKLSTTGDTSTVLKSAVEKLLAGPGNASVTTTIPPDTKLQSLEMREDGIHINLSPEFTSGGGSASMTARVAQILYTATSLDPNVRVWLEVDGKPLETLGGEGLLVDQPLTRKTFEQNFSL